MACHRVESEVDFRFAGMRAKCLVASGLMLRKLPWIVFFTALSLLLPSSSYVNAIVVCHPCEGDQRSNAANPSKALEFFFLWVM